MNKLDLINFYQQKIDAHNDLLNEAKKKSRFLSMIRLLIFVSTILGFYFALPSWSVAIIGGVGAMAFVFVVHRWLDAKEEKTRQELYVKLNQNELALHYGDWSHFDDGERFKNASHAFSNDLDLFGRKSFYQLVNRTVLPKAQNMFADALNFGVDNIEETNNAIASLSQQIDWCQKFIVESQLSVGDQASFNELDSITTLPDVEKKNQIFKWIVPIVFVAGTVAMISDVISSTQYMFVIFFNFGLVGSQLKKSNKIIIPVKEKIAQVRALRRQLEQVQELKTDNAAIDKIVAELTNGEKSALHQLRKLEKIQKRFEFRDNLLMGTLLNLMLGWDFLVLTQYQKWINENGGNIANLQIRIAQIEVWISGAVYNHNFPDAVFCEFHKEDEYTFEALGHPFVDVQKLVPNTVRLSKEEHYLITTGPNMAGKSTFLRSVGLAICCANAGLPILAKEVCIPKVRLYSSMRTSDNLNNESSYFHAELTRLRFIMDAIEAGEKTFIILDEILKGTNSKDKEIGSAKFLQKLVRLNSKGIIATHDLSLTNLSNGNQEFRNVYFDSTIEGDNLSFDYKLRDGVCQNMNASFLLAQMALVDK